MKPSSRDYPLGLASPLNYAAIPSGNIKNPSNKEAGLDVSHHTLVSREGRGENFVLDILFNRMSEMGMFQQLSTPRDVGPLFEDCGGEITVRLGFRTRTQFVCFRRVLLSQIDLPGAQQQSCKIVDREAIVLAVCCKPPQIVAGAYDCRKQAIALKTPGRGMMSEIEMLQQLRTT